jgi:SpoVK/Ycf46/Vps4 family AAA+-type ATPase
VIDPRVTLDDVVLPPGEKALLERFVDHARHRRVVTREFGFTQRGGRGLGVTALFHGESGTGKTFAAEAIAGALGLKLAVVDMATVSSKWVGESEKNWRRIFDAAERGGVVLFIDEADAKFSKRRQEGSSSQEYYINAETDYLLTRTENFSGVGILATNMKSALDSAFIRRLRFIVGFPFPSATERREIWKKVFPRKDALGDLDYDEFARVAISGGSIFNAALAAAHNAAAAKSKIETAHVLDAIHHELRKLDRPSSLAAPRAKVKEAAA